MEIFRRLEAVAAPLPIAGLDTDTLIPMERMIGHSISRTGLGPHLLAPLRYRGDGSPDPGFILNRKPYSEARILVTGENFGCGSSREAAVWALAQFGIRCIIAPSFGEIFRNNAFKNGLLPIVLPAPEVRKLSDEVAVVERCRLVVDLGPRVILRASGEALAFPLEEFRRAMLLEGRDQLDFVRAREMEISRFEEQDAVRRPWLQR